MEASPLLLVFTLITAVLLCSSQLLLRFLAIILTAAASNYWVFIPAFLVIAVFLFFRWYYLKTSREIKRLEAIGRFQVSSLRNKLKLCGMTGYSHVANTVSHFFLPHSYPLCSLQLAVLSTLTYPPLYKGYPPSGHLANRVWHLTTSTSTKMNTHR